MSLGGIFGGDTTKVEKPKLTPDQQKVYDERLKKLAAFTETTIKQKQELTADFPEIYTAQYIKIITDGLNNYKSIIEQNPTLTNEALEKESKKYTSITDLIFITSQNGMVWAYLIRYLPMIYKISAEELVRQKKFTEEQKKELITNSSAIQEYVDSITDKTTIEDISKKYDEFRAKNGKIYAAAKVDDPTGLKPKSNDPKGWSLAAVMLVKNYKQKANETNEITKAEKASFSTKRLVNEILSIMSKTVTSLLIIMLFLVSGMLTANDAIGRDWRYRVLYFFYGGLGFPIMLTFYLYRWFIGTAPKIYRLLPIFTEQADTTLGRFLWFPFTYEEDDAARQAKTDFMKKAAELVGKKYSEQGAAGDTKEKMSGVLKAMEALGVSKEAAELAEKGVNVVSNGASAVAETLDTMVDKMKDLKLERISFEPTPQKS